MQFFITGRHLELTDDIRVHVEKKIGKVEDILNNVIEANVILDVQGHRYVTEVTLMARRATFHAQAETEDVFASIDEAVDKIDKQIRRHKERIKDRRHRFSRREAALQLTGIEEAESAETLDTDDEAEARQIVRIPERFAPKPMTADEAAMQLEVSQDDFVMFLNAQTEQVNVVYCRRNGDYGWIEPKPS